MAPDQRRRGPASQSVPCPAKAWRSMPSGTVDGRRARSTPIKSSHSRSRARGSSMSKAAAKAAARDFPDLRFDWTQVPRSAEPVCAPETPSVPPRAVLSTHTSCFATGCRHLHAVGVRRRHGGCRSGQRAVAGVARRTSWPPSAIPPPELRNRSRPAYLQGGRPRPTTATQGLPHPLSYCSARLCQFPRKGLK